jgi:hypothetical protein
VEVEVEVPAFALKVAAVVVLEECGQGGFQFKHLIPV